MLAVERNSIRDDKFELRILGTKPDFFCEEIACFDCGEDDLNEFFHEDAFAHKEHLLAETYCFQPIEATEEGLFFPVALVSFLNDSIVITKEERKGKKEISGGILKRMCLIQNGTILLFLLLKLAV